MFHTQSFNPNIHSNMYFAGGNKNGIAHIAERGLDKEKKFMEELITK